MDTATPDALDLGEVEVAVIGAGFSGLGMAIRLREAGIDDFVVLERGTDVGGTWWANTYPGCACDVPSHLYSFSFAPNPDWSQTYSTQPEIRDYLRGVVERFDLRRNIRLGHEARQATWDEDAAAWELETSHGRLRARVLVTGMGPLTEPKIPDLPGLDSLRGPGLPLRTLGPLGGCVRQASRGCGDGRVGDPVRARDPAEGRAAARLPAHPAVGRSAYEPADQELRADAVPAGAVGPAAGAGSDLHDARDARARLRQAPAADACAGACRAPPHRAPGPGSRAAREGHAGL